MRIRNVIVVAMVCANIACAKIDDPTRMPRGAYAVQDAGNGWVSFKWRGQCFLMGHTSASASNNYTRTVTKVDCHAYP